MSPDGHSFATGCDDGSVHFWDASTGAAVRDPLRAHSCDVISIAYSPDGRRIATSGAWDRSVRIWDLVTGDLEMTFKCPTEVEPVAYSPSGMHIVFGAYDGIVRIWDINTGNARELRGHKSNVHCVAYSPDGQFIASASKDRTLRCWNATTGEETKKPILKPVIAIAFSPDGRCTASVYHATTISCFWDFATHKPLTAAFPIDGHGMRPGLFTCDIAHSPDGRRVASASRNGIICIWNTPAFTLPENYPQRLLSLRANSSHTGKALDGELDAAQQWDERFGRIEHGWIKDFDGKTMLLWVPEQYRFSLSRYLVGVIHPEVGHVPVKPTIIDYEKLFQYSGTNWTKIFKRTETLINSRRSLDREWNGLTGKREPSALGLWANSHALFRY